MALLGLGQARAGYAQDSTSVPTPATTLIDRRFPVGEPVVLRVPLERGKVYRVWLSRPARIRGIPKERRVFPYFVDVTRSSLIDNGVEFEVYPAYTGPVTILIEPATPDSVTDVVLWRDVAGTIRGDPNDRGADGNWEFGFEVAGGLHGPMGRGRTGGDYEGCMTIRRGGGRDSRLSGCLLGLATYLRPGSGKVTVFFLEPRVRLSGAPLTIQHGGTAIGLAFRVALFGSAEGVNPSFGGVELVGLGTYVEHAFGDAVHASGLGARLAAMIETGSEGATSYSTLTARFGMTYHF